MNKGWKWTKLIGNFLLVSLILLIPLFINYEQLTNWDVSQESAKWITIGLSGLAALTIGFGSIWWLIKMWVVFGKSFKKQDRTTGVRAGLITLGTLSVLIGILLVFMSTMWIISILDAFKNNKGNFDDKLFYFLNAHVGNQIANDPIKGYWLKTSFLKLDPVVVYLISTTSWLVLKLFEMISFGLVNKQSNAKNEQVNQKPSGSQKQAAKPSVNKNQPKINPLVSVY